MRLCGRADLSEEPGQEMQPWVQIWLRAPQQAPLIFPVSSKSAWCTGALDRGADKWDSPKGWKAICSSWVLHTIQSLHSLRGDASEKPTPTKVFCSEGCLPVWHWEKDGDPRTLNSGIKRYMCAFLLLSAVQRKQGLKEKLGRWYLCCWPYPWRGPV